MLQTWGLQRYQKENQALEFSWEFSDIFKNAFFTEHHRINVFVFRVAGNPE